MAMRQKIDREVSPEGTAILVEHLRKRTSRHRGSHQSLSGNQKRMHEAGGARMEGTRVEDIVSVVALGGLLWVVCHIAYDVWIRLIVDSTF